MHVQRLEGSPLPGIPATAAWLVAGAPIQHTFGVILTDGLLDHHIPLSSSQEHTPDVLGRVPGGTLRRLVIVDHHLLHNTPHGPALRAWLDSHEIDYELLTVRGSERSKSARTVARICRALDKLGVGRHPQPISVLVFGGGVVTDTAGFAASIYRRGVARINFGTNLLCAVDAAFAWKTAIDFNGNKNRLGAYTPPNLVVLDRHFFGTLDDRSLRAAVPEIIKLALVADEHLFALLERHGRRVLDEKLQGLTTEGDKAAWDILESAVPVILTPLAEDPTEHNSERAVYAGHNVADVVEMAALERSRSVLPRRRRSFLHHGEAVGLDLLLSTGIAVDRGLLPDADYERVANLFLALGLPTWDPLLDDHELLARGIAQTTYHRGYALRWPLPTRIGAVTFANDLQLADLTRALDRQRELDGPTVL